MFIAHYSGGCDGAKGRNILITADGPKDLGGKKSIDVNPEVRNTKIMLDFC